MPMAAFRAIALLPLLVLPTALHAAEVGGYLPLNLEPRLEADVIRLLTLADRTVMRRPIPLQDITEALPDACAVDRPLCTRVQRELAPWLASAALVTASAEAALASSASNPDSARLPLPNERGQTLDSTWQLAAAGFVQLSPLARVNAGAVVYSGRISPAGSFISLGGPRAQIEVGYRERWWSPMHDSALLQSTTAPALPSVGIANTEPLTRARISYEAFVGQLSYSDRIASTSGGLSSGHPLLAGGRISIEPVRGWSISGARLIEYGGASRPYGALDAPRLLINGTGNLGTLTANELGNEEVSISSQLTVPGTHPVSVYMEYGAEDTFHVTSYHFGNGALSAGIYLPRLTPATQLRYEFSNWEDVWYVHHLYGDGLKNYGVVMGNWAADWRRPSDYAGGQSHMLALDWDRTADTRYSAVYRTTQNASYTGGHYQRAHLLELTRLKPWGQFDVALSVQGGVDPYGHSFGRLQSQFNWRPESLLSRQRSTSESAAPASNTRTGAGVTVERFVDVGLYAGQLRYERDSYVLPTIHTQETNTHVGVGIRRSVTAHGDMGARIELDQIAGHSMLELRALDYRYRFTGQWAASGFFGFARYDVKTPAHGFYLGGGMQRREIWPGWDLNLEARYLDRIVRKKITPGEVTLIWPNEFWSMLAGTVSLSRRL